MNIYSTTLSNQQTMMRQSKPAFSGRAVMPRERAVDLMCNVRTSYNDYSKDMIAGMIKKMTSELKAIKKYQKNGGEEIFRASEFKAVKSKINMLKQLIELKK